MLTIKSKNDKIIRLPDERWLHIVEGHPEMAGHLNDVLSAVVAPDYILQGTSDELLAAVHKYESKWLVVVYKEDIADGFIITAFFTTKTDKLLKRIILWQK